MQAAARLVAGISVDPRSKPVLRIQQGKHAGGPAIRILYAGAAIMGCQGPLGTGSGLWHFSDSEGGCTDTLVVTWGTWQVLPMVQ
jgi:hypothetical protein